MKLVKGPLLFVVVCIVGSTTVVLAKNGDHMDESLLVFLVRYFHYLAEIQNKCHRQHAFLTVLTEEEAHWNTPVIFQPSIVFPTCEHTLTPANPEDYGNHLAAIPKLRSKPNIHTEVQLLHRLDELIAAFRRNGSEVAVIVLYTYRAPCQECTQMIVAYFTSRHQGCRNIIVVYTKDTGHNINASYAAKMFHQNGIKLYQISKSDLNFTSNTAEESGVILDFENFIESFFPDSESMFDSHDSRCDKKRKDEEDAECWKEKCSKELIDHTSPGRYKMKNKDEEEMGDDLGEEDEERWKEKCLAD